VSRPKLTVQEYFWAIREQQVITNHWLLRWPTRSWKESFQEKEDFQR
jgi:hypothetical protein